MGNISKSRTFVVRYFVVLIITNKFVNSVSYNQYHKISNDESSGLANISHDKISDDEVSGDGISVSRSSDYKMKITILHNRH